MTLASIQPILSVEAHPNADLLDIAQVKGYKAIVKRGQWKAGDLCVFIEPDSVLPDAPWAAFYKAKSNRVKAIRLRGAWSFGIVESLSILGEVANAEVNRWTLRAGVNVTEMLGVTKYEAPAPQDLNASGPYGFGIPKTDEHRWQGIDDLPYGEKVDVTLKIDGQSWTAFAKFDDTNWPNGEWVTGVGGRSFLYKPESDNHFTRNARTFDVFNKLRRFCAEHTVGLALRGEQYGQGIQKAAHNPHAQLPVSLALFSTWLIDERRYATKGHPLYIHTLAPQLGLPTVPVLERDVVLTPELIKRYAEELETIQWYRGGGSDSAPVRHPFEGVVINHACGSFKIINLHYDARK